ncbi:MAG: prepilin-type N-terminal cleavage/methylation domain-containing protein [Candidatus Pacebacteria bacterium]|nr:prepilin-type N-terminal cleavage/methylation domain-containing protein [Candidatus Paceibacterota bacterium]
MNTKNNLKGFTLVELLIVIGILAVLSTVVVLVLNPSQLFAQARDSQRISDLSSLNSAISFYLSTASTTVMDGNGGACTTKCWATPNTAPNSSANCGGRYTTGAAMSGASATRTPGPTGWVPIDLRNATGGSPLSSLPVDPTNTGVTNLFYSYACDETNKTYELDANMESTRYASGGSDDKEAYDGGGSTTIYEIGTDPGLDL